MARFLTAFLYVIVAIPAFADVSSITPIEARERALAGEIILVDIRRPDEWTASGMPDVAIPLDMRRKDFLVELRSLIDKADGKPIAYICATSNRSAWLADRLDRAGISDVINVSEGMFGNRDGPGWLKSGLPVRKTGAPPHDAIDIALIPAN